MISSLFGVNSSPIPTMKPVPTLPGLAGWKALEKNLDAELKRFADRPEIKREVDYWKQNAATKGKTAASLAADPRLLRFASTAFNLEKESAYKKMVEKVLEEGFLSRNALANKLSDPRYKDMASVFQYRETVTPRVSDPKFVDDIASRFVRQKFEDAVGVSNPDMKSALYFDRKASSFKDWFQVMGDRTAYKFMLNALNLSDSVMVMNLDQQRKFLQSKYDITKLQKTGEVDKLVERVVAKGANNSLFSGSSMGGNPSSSIISIVNGLSGRGY
jgi:hypothetical protein